MTDTPQPDGVYVHRNPTTAPDVYGVPGDSIVVGDGGRSITESPPYPIDPLAPEVGGQWAGKWNLFAGRNAGQASTSGNMNTFIGSGAGQAVTVGDQLTFVGAFAGQLSTDNFHCTCVGCGAGQEQEHGSFNVAVGTDCMLHSQKGSYNTAVGCEASSKEGGLAVSCLGACAGMNGIENVGCTFLGAYTDGPGSLTNATAIGYRAVVTKNNQLVLGSSAVVETILRGNVQAPMLSLGNATLSNDDGELVVSFHDKTGAARRFKIVLSPIGQH
jgi:hypothetical protein